MSEAKGQFIIMKTSVTVKLQTGLFEWTNFRLKATAQGLTFRPTAKGVAAISIPASSIRVITFYEEKLKMEIQTDTWTDAYFINGDDWFETVIALKAALGLKLICELS